MRIVIKVGTDVIVEKGFLNEQIICDLVEEIANLWEKRHQIILVSSGAIACGKKNFGEDTLGLAVSAMVGQIELMNYYKKLFLKKGIKVCQALYSYYDLEQNPLFIAATLERALKFQILPIINYNDAASDKEIIELGILGDNDFLAAKITEILEAKLLIIFTKENGLKESSGRVIKKVTKITPKILECCWTDGMKKKILAASKTKKTVICSFEKGILEKILKGQTVGTLVEIKN